MGRGIAPSGSGPPSTSRIGRPDLFLLLACSALFEVASGVTVTMAQDPPGSEDPVSIDEYRRLIAGREAEVVRLEAVLDGLEVRRDSLLVLKDRAEPGSNAFEDLSNRIRENADRIRPVQRDLRVLYRDLKDLKTGLFLRYNAEIGRVSQRIDELRDAGETPETNRELRRLVDRLPEYLSARLRLEGEIEEAEQDLVLPDLVYLPTDDPGELRWKEAAARDAVDKIDRRIEAIEKQIENEVQRKRIREEAERLRRDLELWGDDESVQQGGELEQLLERRGRGQGAGGVTDPFADPDDRIQQLQARRLELIDRRAEYAEKAATFASRLREFYR